MSRQNYWSCNKFADWLRGTPKPKCASLEDWGGWRKNAKKRSPFRYWLAETALSKLQDFVNWPLDLFRKVRYYCVNRWVLRTHALTASPKDIKPGQWMDLGDRLLPCLFNELANYVEVELAYHTYFWDDEFRAKNPSPWLKQKFPNLLGWRMPAAGMYHLDWASELRDEDGALTPQAKTAREIKSLYLWWKLERANRPDPYEVSGMSKMDRNPRDDVDDLLDGLFLVNTSPEYKEARKKLGQIEEDFEKEDDAMLIRLVKLRKSLWN